MARLSQAILHSASPVPTVRRGGLPYLLCPTVWVRPAEPALVNSQRSFTTSRMRPKNRTESNKKVPNADRRPAKKSFWNDR
jgi:hypothetical protein